MEANIDQFLQLVRDIEENSWWSTRTAQHSDHPAPFTFSMSEKGGAQITDVPSEPLESLLLRVRRLTMVNSPENLHAIQKKAKSTLKHRNLQNLYEAWHKFWRLAFIKEPYILELEGQSQVMTAYRAYNIFINGQLFHSDPQYQVILYGTSSPTNIGDIHLFLRNQFHWTAANLCIAALGLRLLINTSNSMILTGQPEGVTDYVWCRNQLNEVDEQYRIFSDWIEQHGGCQDCRW